MLRFIPWLIILVLACGVPLAQATQCIMMQPAQAAIEDCAYMVPAKLPSTEMTVADCFKLHAQSSTAKPTLNVVKITDIQAVLPPSKLTPLSQLPSQILWVSGIIHPPPWAVSFNAMYRTTGRLLI